jgi:hypothetical protein
VSVAQQLFPRNLIIRMLACSQKAQSLKEEESNLPYLGGSNQEKKLIFTWGYQVNFLIKYLKNKFLFLCLSVFY